MTPDLDRLEALHKAVNYFPETVDGGFMKLLELRNEVPALIAELRTYRLATLEQEREKMIADEIAACPGCDGYRFPRHPDCEDCTAAVDERIAAARAALAAAPVVQGGEAYQHRVHAWILACFGPEIGADRVERNHRFIEEALELVQSGGATASECHQLVDYVFGRAVGDLTQEVGGVLNTLAALCTAHGVDMDVAGEKELTRVWTKVETIRAKQKAKPKHSPLPAALQPPAGTL